MSSDLIELKCSNCGAPLVVDDDSKDFFVEVGDGFLFVGSGEKTERFVCEHCGYEFRLRDHASRAQQRGRSVFIKGKVTNSTIITGDGNTVIR